MADRQVLDAAVASLYETVLDAQRWDAAIVDLARLFAAHTACMFSFDFVSSRAYDLRMHGFDADVRQRYESYYCRLDPGASRALAAGVGEWVADEVLLDLRSQPDQEYVQDFAIPSGIGRVAGVKVAGDATTCTWLSLERRPGAERFGDVARRRYRELEPHLRRVIRMQARLDSMSVGNALARACLDRVQAGVVVVDKARRVKLVNACGAQMLGKGRRLSITHQRLACHHPALEEQFARLVAKACAQPASGGALRTGGDAAHADWLINVLPVPHHHDLAALMPEPLALVVISEANADTVPIDAYRSLFSLTATEAALLSALVRGRSVADWARQRGTSVATVRTQLRSLFDKTGTDSQARLIGLARSVPPIR